MRIPSPWSRAVWGTLLLGLTTVGCVKAPDETSSGDFARRDCRSPIFYRAQAGENRMAVVGDFNGWSEVADPMVDENLDGVWFTLLDLPAGRYLYRIWVDGELTLDPFNPLTLFDDAGVEHSVLMVDSCEAPMLEVVALEASGDGDVSVSLRFLRTRSESPLDPDSLVVTIDGEPMENDLRIDQAGMLHIAIRGLDEGKWTLGIEAADAGGMAAPGLTLPFWVEEEVFSWEDATIYQVVVDRFRGAAASLDDSVPISFFHGGHLDGVTTAIESGYFTSLGVNALWLSPLNDNPERVFVGRDGYDAQAYHGYWPTDPRRVEPRIGGEVALDRLVRVAHSRGIRVLADFVLNHVHREHPYYDVHRADGWFNQPDGDCVCGITCSWAENMNECWFDSYLPDLRWRNPAVVDRLVDDAVYWVERFDLDGLRLDAVPMMPRLATRHLRDKMIRKFGRAGKDVYLLGETYTGTGGHGMIRYYLGPDGLSGQFDFPTMWVMRDVLAGTGSMVDLDRAVWMSAKAWEGSDAVMATILGNHDVPRIVSGLNGDGLGAPRENPPGTPEDGVVYERLRLAWTFAMTQPGASVIYYGDEIGMPGAGDPDNRRPMRFGAALSAHERSVLSHVRVLGMMRAGSTALRRGHRETLWVDDDLYVYGRDADDGYPVLVAINRGELTREISVEIPLAWRLGPDARFCDVFGSRPTMAGRVVTLTVAPRSSALLMSEEDCGAR